MSEPRAIVGIDLGTTHTVVAYVRLDVPPTSEEAKPRIFPIEQLVAPGEIEARPLLQSLRYHPALGELAEGAMTLPWAIPELAGSSGPYITGELARSLGTRVPGRLVASAKSWLSHAGVDRSAAILPWGAPDGIGKVSPVVASASYLAHVHSAWNAKFPAMPLAEQEIVLTIPASFDEGARAYTLEAARLAGLPRVRLVEEPQAAFYDWLGRAPDVAQVANDVKLALVIDVGGGTTDLTFIRIEPRASETSSLRLSRIAVGDHLMLGGDNMDLLLAREAEAQLGGKLPSARFTQLVQQCRDVKERLLGDAPPERARVTVLGSGSKLIESALSAELQKSHVHSRIVDGFFPEVGVDARPQRRASAIVEFGLPYVADAAITKHVAAFIARHQNVAKEAVGDGLIDGLALPDAVLLNGGVFRGEPLATRMIDVLRGFRKGAPLRVLENTEPELAVARGAVFYGLARRGVGMKIGGGSARSYFLMLGAQKGQETKGERAVCLLPRGAEEGEEVHLHARSFALKLGQPVRFHLASSVGQAAYVRAGDLVELVDEAPKPGEGDAENDVLFLERDLFRPLPPIAAVLDDRPSEGKPAASREARVTLAAMLTEIGTLEMSCFAEADPTQRWNLELQLRGDASESELTPQRITQLHPRFAEAKAKIDIVFGKSETAMESKPWKTLRQDLEKILGPRASWETPLLRELWGSLFAGAKRRRRSDDHERVWFNLIGFCLRPGLGYPLDGWRVKQLFELFDQGVQFAPEAQNWSEWWTLWRRVSGGLDASQQTKILNALEFYLHPPGGRTRARPGGPRAQGYDDMVRLAASLERVSAEQKTRIGNWLIERLQEHNEGSFSWWAVGRIGARVPFHGSAHTTVSRGIAEQWLASVLALDWAQVEPAAFAAMQLARASGDRQRDIDEKLREEVIRRLEVRAEAQGKPVPPTWISLVREPSSLEAETAQRILGESLPPGLVLV